MSCPATPRRFREDIGGRLVLGLEGLCRVYLAGRAMGLPSLLRQIRVTLLASLWGIPPAEAARKPLVPVGINWHEDFIVHIAAVARPRVYVELGLYRCALFNKVVPYAQHLIGVDFDPAASRFMVRSPKTEFVCSSTKEFALELKDRGVQIDVLFIDADHSKQAVLDDFHAYAPFVSPHGLILLHDTYPGDVGQTSAEWSGDCYLAIPILQQSLAEFEMVTIPVPPGLTICRKRTSQLSWTWPT